MATHLVSNTDPVDTSRYECQNGHLVERPLPTVTHAKLQLHVVTLIREAGSALDITALPEVSIDESESSRNEWLTPDGLVASGGWFREKTNGHALPPALLAVEILSEGQNFFNMRPKANTLMRWGIGHIWLIDPESSTAMVLDAQNPDVGQVVFDGPLRAGDLTILLSQIFG
jgi:Uma2 family endonuclease